MNRRTAFNRPSAGDRLRIWWYAQSGTARVNGALAAGVAVAALALVMAATAGDPARQSPLATGTRPSLTSGVPSSTSTTIVGRLFTAGAVEMGPTTSSTLAAETSATAPATPAPTTRSGGGQATTRAPAPTAEPEPEPAVPGTEVPAATTTTGTSQPATTTTAPPPASSTTRPPTTTTTTPLVLLPLPRDLPPLLGG